MNILPKKRWHVRTKDNVARVRRDEAAAREKQRISEAKAKQAESEARINFLRQKSNLSVSTAAQQLNDGNIQTVDANGHVDLFSDFKNHVKTTNSELEKEKKEEKEKYEKQIGYLTYLGQDTNEALKLRSWYEVAPKRTKTYEDDAEDDRLKIEKDLKTKYIQDPLTLINALIPPEKKKQSTNKIKMPIKFIEPIVETKAVESKEILECSFFKFKKLKKHKKLKKKDRKKEKRHKREKERNMKEQIEKLNKIKQRNKIEELRKARLQRESLERVRQENLLASQGKVDETKETKTKLPPTPRIVRKYNSQFNPELAKQNMQ